MYMKGLLAQYHIGIYTLNFMLALCVQHHQQLLLMYHPQQLI